MPKKTTSQSRFLSGKYLPWIGMILALAILGATVLYASFELRRRTQDQIVLQDAQILYALWLNQELSTETDSQLRLSTDAADQLPAVLETARLPQLAGLLGTRLYHADGKLVFSDPNLAEASLSPEDYSLLSTRKPVARFLPEADRSTIMLLLPTSLAKKGPILEVTIPLHLPNQAKLLGIAQFILDGENIAREFQTLDRNLATQATLAFCCGGGLLVLIIGLSFRQLQLLNRRLQERTEHLLQANQELALAAKTSAVGAVTAHLIHGLRNPLSGLQTFVSSRGTGPDDLDETDWQMAISTTRRMQNMISEIVRVLRDEHGNEAYELSLDEFVQMLHTKVQPLAKESSITFSVQTTGESVLANRDANLISLILYNLIQNAIQATPQGGKVTLSVVSDESVTRWEVADQGPGIPPERQAQLFKPCKSSKEGGSGVGLAISQQLASCLEATLKLKQTGPNGTIFALSHSTRRNTPDHPPLSAHQTSV